MKKIVLFALIVALYSCAATDYMFSTTSYKVDIDSYSMNKSLPKEYFLGTDKNTDPFLNAEIEGYIVKILSLKGFKRVFEKNPGIYLVAYSVAMTEENKTVTRIYPIQGITGTSTQSKTNGEISSYGNSAYGSAKTNESTTYHRGTVGYGAYQKPVTNYAKNITLVGGIMNDPNDSMKFELLWKMNAGTWSGGNDLRKSIPFILSGCAEYINTNTKGIVSKEIYPSNQFYQSITRTN